MASASEVLKRLEILRRKQDDEGWHVNANTCSLALETIERQATALRDIANHDLIGLSGPYRTILKTMIEVATAAADGVTPAQMSDDELKDRLRDVAIKVFPSANQWAVAEGVKNVVAIMDEIGPVEYAALRSALHKIGSSSERAFSNTEAA